MLPSLFRTELWHPLTVHFPIALLVTGTFLRFISAVASMRRPFFYNSAALITLFGALTSWVTWYTGNRAEEEVNSALCDPTLTHLHGDLAFYVVLTFSMISLVEIARFVMREKSILKFPFLESAAVTYLLLIASLGGAGLLGYVGHLGAGLTYNQAAGVHVPSQQCTEFQ